MKRSYKPAATASFAAILLTAACTTESVDDVTDVDGIEVLSQDDTGTTGVIERDGMTLRFETQAAAGKGTTGAIARIIDDHERMIAVGFFGHDMPPAWISKLDDIQPDDPARLALAHATEGLASLALPEAHVRALVLTAKTVPLIIDLESRVETDPDTNIDVMDAQEPDLQTAAADFYNVLAPEMQVRRAYTLGKELVVESERVAYSTGCLSFDVNKRNTTLLGFTAFRFHQWRNWCWDTVSHRMSGAGSRGSYASSVNSAFTYDGWWVNQDYWMSYPYQHAYQTQGQFRNCVVKYGCIGTYYPWIKSVVDGWGSWWHSKGG